MLQYEINELKDKTVEIVVTHGDDMVCRFIGTLYSDGDGTRVESISLINKEVRTNFVWFDERKSKIECREHIPLICYYI